MGGRLEDSGVGHVRLKMSWGDLGAWLFWLWFDAFVCFPSSLFHTPASFASFIMD